MPDPLKSIIKFGRRDMYCLDHVSESWISFADNNHQAFLNAYARLAVAHACGMRLAL